jgi:hypothetical protein
MDEVSVTALKEGCSIAAAYHHLLHSTQHTTMSRIPNPATRTEHGVSPLIATQGTRRSQSTGAHMSDVHFPQAREPSNRRKPTHEVYLFIGRETHRETGDQKNSEIIFILG